MVARYGLHDFDHKMERARLADDAIRRFQKCSGRCRPCPRDACSQKLIASIRTTVTRFFDGRAPPKQIILRAGGDHEAWNELLFLMMMLFKLDLLRFFRCSRRVHEF